MVEGEGSGGPIESILSRTGLEEAEDGRFGKLEGTRRSGLCWRETAGGDGAKERSGVDVEVSGVG